MLRTAWRGMCAGRLLAGGWSALDHREQLPGSLDALQRMDAAVLQGDIGSNDQVAHGPGGENLPRPRSGHHPGGDVDRDPTDVIAAQLDLASVQARPDVQADAGQLVAEGGRAADPPAGPVEGGQDAVTGGLDQLAVELLDRLAHPAEELLDQVEGQLRLRPDERQVGAW